MSDLRTPHAIETRLLAIQATLDDLARRFYAHVRQQREQVYSNAVRRLNPSSEN